MEKIKTLQECKDLVAQREGYTSWDWIIAEYPANTKSNKSTEDMLEEAANMFASQFKEEVKPPVEDQTENGRKWIELQANTITRKSK